MVDLSEALSAPGATGMAYDNANGILYISTLSGELLRYDAKAGAFLSAIYLGGDLSSVAVSPDGSFVLAGQLDPTTNGQGPSYATIDRVSTSTSAVVPLEIQISNTPISGLAGIQSVAITSNGEAYATADGEGWQFNAAAANPAFQTAPLDTNLSVSDQGRYLLETTRGISPPPFEVYDTSSGKALIQSSLPNYPLSLDMNDSTGQIASLTYYNTLTVYDKNLNIIKQFTDFGGGIPGDFLDGVHFSSNGQSLYILDATQEKVLIYSTSSWTETGSISLPSGALTFDTPEAMSVSSDGRFLFIQTTSGIDSIDLTQGAVVPTPAQDNTAGAGIDAIAKGNGSVSINVAGSLNTIQPTTIDVTGNYVVSSSQNLVLNETQTPAFTLIGQVGQPDPNLTIQGSVNLSSTLASETLTGVADNGGTTFSHSLIKVAQGGSLVVDASGASSAAYGYNSGDFPAGIENDGLWSVTATGAAVGASMFEDAKFTNTGTFDVTGNTAEGVVSGYTGTYVNSGQMTITGHASALGLGLGYYEGGSFTNNGTITVSADAGNPSVGISISGLYEASDPFVINNTGTISARTAITEQNGSSPAQTPLTFLNNSGTINGNIDLGNGYPVEFQANGGEGSQVVNTGTINGDIYFDNGNTLYSGAQGHMTGVIHLGAGTDRVVLGNDGEAVHGGSGYDDIVGGAGNDVITGGTGQTTFSYETAASAVTVSLAISGPQNTGGAGTDTLIGVDDLVGSSFNDTLTASGSHQALEGGAGDDTLIAGVGDEVLDGGTGTDTVVLGGPASSFTVTQMQPGYDEVVGPNGTYELYNDEVLKFTDQQVVIGSSAVTVTARDGGDTLIGGPGNDTFITASGTDVINGEGGDDTAVFSGDYADYALGRSGATLSVTGDGTSASLTGIEILQFADEQSVVGSGGETLTARPGGDFLQGGAGNDVLNAGSGTDTIDGGGGTNTVVFSGHFASYVVSQNGGATTVAGDGTSATLTNVQSIDFPDAQMALGSTPVTLTARTGGDTLIGGSGNDTFIPGSGTDTIDGGAGVDTVIFSGNYAAYHLSQSGSATIVAGSGGTTTVSDVEILQFSDRQMVLGSAGETLTARTGGDTLVGGPGADTLTGGAGNDVIIGGGGNDAIDGAGGTNTAVFSGAYSGYQVVQNGGTTTVTGGGGVSALAHIQFLQFADAQMILGTAGASLTARAGGDTLIGGSGNDTLTGGAGDDTFIGGGGNDTIDGGGGNDTVVFSQPLASYQIGTVNGVLTVTGPDGTDALANVEQLQFADQTVAVSSLPTGIVGTSGNDTLTGTSGNDTIYGLAGNDTLRGGAGNDLLDGGPGNDALYGGAGTDTATYADAASGVTVSLLVTGAQNTGGAGTDTLTSIENLTGSPFGDTLTAGTSGSVLQGMGGDDTLVSGAGNDTLDGGAGNDTASYALATAAVTVSLAISGPQNTVGAGTDTLISIENLIGSKFNDTLTPGAGTEAIDGGAGTDTVVYAGPSTDYVIGQSGGATTVAGDGQADTLTNVEVLRFADEQLVITGAGASVTARAAGDTLIGGAGADKLIGGAGNDVLIGNGGNDALNGGSGTNTAVFHGAFSAYTITQNNGATQVKGPDGTDSLTKIQILQFDDRQMVNGSAGETLNARAGGDTLVGGAGNDHLIGGAGNDVLIGGAGQDTLTGGGGQDRFVFTALADSKVSAPDLITDFVSGDHIDLSAIDANTNTAGHQAFHFGATSGHTGDIVVHYDAAHDRTVIDLYVNKDATADAEIWLSGNHALSAADFVL